MAEEQKKPVGLERVKQWLYAKGLDERGTGCVEYVEVARFEHHADHDAGVGVACGRGAGGGALHAEHAGARQRGGEAGEETMPAGPDWCGSGASHSGRTLLR